MTLKTIELGFAERQVVNGLLTGLDKVDLSTARTVRAVRERLELREAGNLIDKMVREAEEDGFPPPSWDDMLDPPAEKDLRAEMEQELADIQGLGEGDDKKVVLAEATQSRYERKIRRVKQMQKRTFTADDAYLRWLQEKLEKKDWEKAKRGMPDGSTQEIKVQVSVPQMVAIANLADALSDALAKTEEDDAV